MLVFIFSMDVYIQQYYQGKNIIRLEIMEGMGMNYQNEYLKLQNEADLIQEKMDKILQEYANKECPFKIGETVTICGWAHKGKKGIVRGITGICYGDKMSWKVHGNVLRKDGSEGQHFFAFSESYFKAQHQIYDTPREEAHES
jgi:hypothetical protein